MFPIRIHKTIQGNHVGLVSYKIIAGFLIFLSSMLVFAHVLRKKSTLSHTESVELGEAAASGIFLGAAFFHMLPDSINSFQHVYGTLTYPIPELICVIGFLLLVFLERISLTHSAVQSKHTVPYILTGILTIHAIIEGAALGIGATFSETIMLFIAIMAHKASETFALCMLLVRHELSTRHITLIAVLFSLMTPIGIALGTGINFWALTANGELIAAVFNAFAAGTFLYISTLHHVRFHKHTEEQQGYLEFGCLLAGLSMMGVIALWT